MVSVRSILVAWQQQVCAVPVKVFIRSVKRHGVVIDRDVHLGIRVRSRVRVGVRVIINPTVYLEIRRHCVD